MSKFFCNGADSECACPILCADCTAADWTGGTEIKTNGDRIRAMRDEELAKLLLDGCRGSKCDEQPQNEFGSVNCFQCRMNWLQRPAEEDDHD